MKRLTDLLKKLFVDWWQKQKPDPEPEYKDDLDISKVVVLKTDKARFAQFKITCGLKRIWLSGGQIWWEYNTDPKWRDVGGVNGNIWMYWKDADGNWHGSPCDGIRTGQNHKPISDFKHEYDPWPPPSDGETVALGVSTICRNNQFKNGEERSNVVVFTWPPR